MSDRQKGKKGQANVITSGTGASIGAAGQVGEAVAQAQHLRSDAIIHTCVAHMHLVLDDPPGCQVGIAEAAQYLHPTPLLLIAQHLSRRVSAGMLEKAP